MTVSTKKLTEKKCKPCEGDAEPLSRTEAKDYIDRVPGWDLKEKSIERKFKFDDFEESMEFINNVAGIAEEEGHHPDIHVYYNKVTLELTTHNIGGLSENDFIMAAKINDIL